MTDFQQIDSNQFGQADQLGRIVFAWQRILWCRQRTRTTQRDITGLLHQPLAFETEET